MIEIIEEMNLEIAYVCVYLLLVYYNVIILFQICNMPHSRVKIAKNRNNKKKKKKKQLKYQLVSGNEVSELAN